MPLNSNDLGDLSNQKSLLIFGGCYSNLEALNALFTWAETKGYSADQCICTGDIVAYCADPVATVKKVKDWGVHCIQGNVEESLAENIDHCGCGFDAGSTCDVLSRGWFQFADNQVAADDRRWFASLPNQLHFSFAGKSCQVVHGAPSDISRFMYASQADDEFLSEIQQSDLIIAGHSGLPFTKQIAGKTWHNSGALGMPANDGSRRVWFSTITLDSNDDVIIEHHALSYDANSAHEKMIKVGLDQGYHQSLLDGLWPSMDVLPETERQAAGVALQAQVLRV